MKGCVVFASALLLPSLAMAASIVVHNTGVDSSDVLVAPGASTAFWLLSSKPGGATETIGSNPFRFNCCYWADQSNAAWVSTVAGGSSSAGGNYVYDLQINLTGLDPSSAVISGKYGSDNSGQVWLNGNAPVLVQGSNFGSYPASPNFTISSGFVPGINTIHVQVTNEGNPTAFFVQFTSATANAAAGVPEPGAMALTFGALAGLTFLRRRTARRA